MYENLPEELTHYMMTFLDAPSLGRVNQVSNTSNRISNSRGLYNQRMRPGLVQEMNNLLIAQAVATMIRANPASTILQYDGAIRMLYGADQAMKRVAHRFQTTYQGQTQTPAMTADQNAMNALLQQVAIDLANLRIARNGLPGADPTTCPPP